MKKYIIISPFAQKMRNGRTPNPKDYPYWKEVVLLLQHSNFKVIQIGVQGEEPIGADYTYFNLSLDQLKSMLDLSATWISVDNFFHHFCALHGRRGVAIFGKSDPHIFGHDQNVNLLKDRSYLREKQFDIWEVEDPNSDAFISPDIVLREVKRLSN